MSKIERINVEPRYSDVAIYNGTVYLAGQVPIDPTLDMYGQTKQVLQIIDELLAQSGSDKHHILMTQIFITNMTEITAMNKAWDEWVSTHAAPPRATVEARLADPDYKIEIVVTAALK